MCVVPPGAQPLLPAKLLPGMGITKDFPVTTTSEEARKFFLQGVSQIHSFWFQESERSCTQALELDPNMAMAHWCIALSAASDYRPAFQLLRDPDHGAGRARRRRAGAPTPDAVARSTNGAAIDPQVRAREAIAKAMALRDTVTPRERLYIEAQAARRAPGNEGCRRCGLHRRRCASWSPRIRTISKRSRCSASRIDNGFEPATKEPREHTMEAIALLEEVVAKDDGAVRRASLPDSCLRRQQDAGEGVARQPALRRAGHQHPARAPHAGSHLRAERQDPGSDLGVLRRGGERAEWIASDSLYPTGHYGHNVHFLIHALNLGGRYDDSMKWVQDLFTYKENPRERNGNNQRTVWRQGYFGLIKSTVRFEKWNEILDGKTIPVYDKPEQNAWRHWAIGPGVLRDRAARESEGDARRHAQGSRRGDVGQGTDRHRRAGARGDDRGARRR